jgi:signal transduction histidine kinase
MSRRPFHGVAAALLVLAIAGLPAGVPVLASERVAHVLDQRDGLPAGEVVQLAQDSRGFIWVGSFAGLVRYDGEQMRPWAPSLLNGHVSVLVTGPHGEVVVRVEPGRRGEVDPSTLYRIVPGGVEPVAGPDGAPLAGVSTAAFGDDGQLCVTRALAVLCRLASGEWVRHVFEDEEARFVHRGPGASIMVLTEAGVWQLDASGGRRKIAQVPNLIDIVAHPDGSLIGIASDPGTLVRIQGGVATTILSVRERAIDVAVRGDVIWASFDRFIVTVRPGEPPEVIGPDSEVPSGGPLLVDQEGSLWLGTYRGVMHLPEPETVVWTEHDGLPSRHTRFLQLAGDTLWVGTWQGLGRLQFTGGRWAAASTVGPAVDGICLDGDRRLWIANVGSGLVRHEPDRRVLYPYPRMESYLGCSQRADGTLWLTTSEGLFATSGGDEPPRRVAPNPDAPAGGVFFRHVLQDRRNRLWVTANEQICHAPASTILGGRAAPWQCRQIAGSRGISSIVELDDGDLWISTDRSGIWRYDEAGGDWSQLPGSTSLPSYSLRGLVRSADGSVWVLGHGTVVRVRDDHTAPEGWVLVERLTGLQGLPSAAAERIVEMPNGALWITTIVGLVQVPARARQRSLAAPAVELVDVIVNGRLTEEVPASSRLEQSDTVELRFATLCYLDRGLLAVQYRMRADDAWTNAPARSATFRFPDLAAGSYMVEVRASLDGQTWTASPARVRFEILPAWYRRNWAMVALAFSAAAVLYGAHRLRLAVFLRLERQRTRIAMDLHDEIGSGLGSINILAGLAAERTSLHSPQSDLLNRIADTAAEVGTSLGEIVWSLRSRSTTLDSLVAHLVERAARLFPSEVPALSLAIPETMPPVRLSLPVRWNVAMIAIEALHNVARHAGATNVVLGLEPHGRRWRLRVEDDGMGLAAGEADAAGVGIENMRRRAAEIAATFDMTRNDRGGLTVALTFDPAFESGSHP